MNNTPSIEVEPTPALTVSGRATSADLRELVAAAARAPSGDNMQPWQFVVNADAGSIEIRVDSSRDTSPMNSGQRMSLIACGAAIENAMLIARERGWHAELELPDALSNIIHSQLVARIRLGARSAPSSTDDYLKTISARVANRRPYDRRPISPIVLDDLERSTPEMDGVTTHWIDERHIVDDLADTIARGDAIMFGEPSMRSAFLSNVRFDLPAKARADEGLSLASLEASAVLGTALRTMKRVPNMLFQVMGGRSIFAGHARKLVRSASGLCVVTVEENESCSELRVGRSMQRAWLALTELGFAAQPMMSLMVLDNALRHGTPELVAALQHYSVEAPLNELRSALRIAGVAGRPAFLLRFGHADAPSGRTGRREIAG